MRKIFFLAIVLFLSSTLLAESHSTRAFYSNFLYAERALPESHLNFEGFISNTFSHLKDPKTSNITKLRILPEYSIKEVYDLTGKIHNMMVDTFYSCARTAPKATSFSAAVNGTNTPDSQHYASLIHSALSLRGIRTSFLKTPYHYGIHYRDPRTSEEMFWCIITPLAMREPPKTISAYVKTFNEFRNKELNPREISNTEIRLISVDEFSNINMPNRYSF